MTGRHSGSGSDSGSGSLCGRRANPRSDSLTGTRSGSISATNFLPAIAAFAGFAAMVIGFWLLLPETFLTVGNLMNVSRQISMLAVVAITMSIVMTMGDFDLSVGSMASLSGVVAAVLFTHDQPIAVAMLASLSIGLAGGFFNGWLVSYVGILPFVATLGTLTIFSGAAFLASDGKTIFGRDIPEAFGGFARRGIPLDSLGLEGLRLPALTIIALIILVIVWHVLERRIFGRHLRIIGGNREAAELAGVPVKRLRLMAFGLTGLGAAAAGLMLASRVASANPTQGAGLMLDAIAAVFLGMALTRRGDVRVPATFIGVVLLGLLDNGLTQLNVDSYWREVLVGVLVLVAVGVTSLRARR